MEKLRGPVGSEITINVLRDGQDPFELKIVRDIIKIRSVRHNIINNVGYVRLTTFSETTTESMKNSIEKIKKETGGKFPRLNFRFKKQSWRIT